MPLRSALPCNKSKYDKNRGAAARHFYAAAPFLQERNRHGKARSCLLSSARTVRVLRAVPPVFAAVPGTPGIFLRLVRHRLYLRRTGGLHLGRGTHLLRRGYCARGAGAAAGIRHLRAADLQQLPAAGPAPCRPAVQCPVRAVCKRRQCTKRRHRPFRAAGGLSAAALAGAVSGILHHQGAHGVCAFAAGTGKTAVPVCGAGFPAEPGTGTAAHPAAGAKGEGRVFVQRVLLVRLHRAQALLRDGQPPESGRGLPGPPLRSPGCRRGLPLFQGDAQPRVYRDG